MLAPHSLSADLQAVSLTINGRWASINPKAIPYYPSSFDWLAITKPGLQELCCMELILNVAWLLLGTGAFAALAVLPRGRGKRSTWTTAAISLFCVLVLLFPVISATDDLHAPRELSDESHRSMKVLAALHAAAVVIPAAYMGQMADLAPQYVSWQSCLADTSPSNPVDGFAHASQGRAPPLYLLPVV